MRSADGRFGFIAARDRSNSSRLRASTECNVTPKARAPAWTSLREDFWSGFAGFQRKATRVMVGTASFRSSSRFAARSGPSTVKPVTFPPGRARLETRPLLTGSPALAMTMGDRRRRLLGRESRGRAPGHDDVHVEPNEVGREIRESLILPLRASLLERNALSFHVAEIAKAQPERLPRRRVGEQADPWDRR